jgi:hypothetical protein
MILKNMKKLNQMIFLCLDFMVECLLKLKQNKDSENIKNKIKNLKKIQKKKNVEETPDLHFCHFPTKWQF